MDIISTITNDTQPEADGRLPLAPFHPEQQIALMRRWAAWLGDQQRQGQLAEATVHLYAKGSRAWVAWLMLARTDKPTSATVGAFLAALLPSHKPGTANALLAGVKSVYRWAASVDAFPDIARPIRPVKVSRDGPLPCLDHAQVGQLISLIQGDSLTALRNRALLLTLYTTACRCISLHRSDVRHLDIVGATLAHRGKGQRGYESTAHLSPTAASACADYLSARHRVLPLVPDAPLWIATDHLSLGKRLGTRTMRHVVQRLMERAGHSRRDLDNRIIGAFSAHSLRRSAVTVAADAHGIEVAQALAGHVSADTTRAAYARAKLHGTMIKVAATLDFPSKATG